MLFGWFDMTEQLKKCLIVHGYQYIHAGAFSQCF